MKKWMQQFRLFLITEEVTYLRYSDKKASDKARRMAYHRDKASAGNERSKAIIAREEAKEATMIFSRIERNKEG